MPKKTPPPDTKDDITLVTKDIALVKDKIGLLQEDIAFVKTAIGQLRQANERWKNEILDANKEWKDEIKRHFDLVAEHLLHDLRGAHHDKIQQHDDRLVRLERHAGLRTV